MECTISMAQYGLSLGVEYMTTIKIVNQLLIKDNKPPSSHTDIITSIVLKGVFHKRVIVPPKVTEVANV